MITRWVARVRATWSGLPVAERRFLVAAVLIGVGIRIAYVLATKDHMLKGDEIEYDLEGRFVAHGKWFWTTTPYGLAHAAAWKAPVYPAGVGILYSVLGPDYDGVLIVQCLLAGVTIALTWLLGRRLFGPRVAVAAAATVALYPGVWQYETRLYSEGLAMLGTLVFLLAVLDRKPTTRRAVAVGVICGMMLLLRPSSTLLFAGVALAWWVAMGLKAGTVRLATTVVVAIAVVAPWTIRNHHVAGGFIPISMQDAAAYGVFNDDAARDKNFPWAWRPLPKRDVELFSPRQPRGDLELRAELIRRARKYVEAHPASIPKAFVWNGIIRTWDLRPPSDALVEVPFEGRSRAVARLALYCYWVLAVLALAGLWSIRKRRGIVLPLIGIAFATVIIFTTDGGTRYRAPLEPIIVLLACAGAARLQAAWRPAGRAVATDAEATSR